MPNDIPLSYIEIQKNHLIHNIKEFRNIIDAKTKIAAVVKANAYGHGDKEVVSILDPYVDYFQVNSVEELARLRTVTKKEILVLGYIQKTDMRKAAKLNCILTIFSLRHAKEINASLKLYDRKQKVHIAIDAYLGREGMTMESLDEFLKEIKKMNNLVVDGIYAHFANIEDTKDFSHALKQIQTYEKCLDIFFEHGYVDLKTHISATSGVLAYEKGRGFHHIVRIGIGMYGMWPSPDLRDVWKSTLALKPIIRWITHIAQIKTLPKGYPIGYGLTYVTKKPTTIAVIPQGYSDGIPRILSNKGSVLIGGCRAPILGRISMNMFVVDVTHIPGVKSYDKVVILGYQGKEEIRAEEIARWSNTINYEVTTRISPLLPRVIR